MATPILHLLSVCQAPPVLRRGGARLPSYMKRADKPKD